VHLSGWDERQIPGGQDSAFVTHQHLKLTIQHVKRFVCRDDGRS
jgi:hypothetical protein